MGEVGASAPPQNFEDRRGARRKKAFLAGKLVYENGARTCACTIRDVSDTGARVEIPVGQILPKNVVLIETRSGIAHECEVRWRAPSAIGLLFHSTFALDGPLPEDSRYLKQIWGGETPGPQIAAVADITAEMIGAGVAAYGAWKPEKFAWTHTEQEMVRAVYMAMHRLARKDR